MALPVRRRPQSALPDISELFESFPMLRPWLAMGSERGTFGIRIEDYTEEGRYVVRAELPGLDPEKEVDITVDDHVLTIHTERTEEEKDKQYREFRYGSFTRSIRLPFGAEEDKISADYANGILTVSMPLREAPEQGRHIPIQRS